MQGAGLNRFFRKFVEEEGRLGRARHAAASAPVSQQRGILSRAVGQCVAALKDASATEAHRAERRARSQSVKEVAAIRTAKQQRRGDSKQHNQGKERGGKRMRGNGRNKANDLRAAESRGSRKRRRR